MIASGINVNLPNKDGDTALDLARYNSNQEAINLLLNHNAIGKDGPSAKEQQWDQIYDAFDASDEVKKKTIKSTHRLR